MPPNTTASVIAAAALLSLVPAGLARAATGSLTYLRDDNVFVSAADGGAAAQVTRDGTPADPYVSASQSASGLVVAVRHTSAYRLAQSGQAVAPPVSLGSLASAASAVSPDGSVVAYEEVGLCGVFPRACVSTAFRSLATGARLPGMGLQMANPTWVDRSVVGAVAGGVAVTGPDQARQQEWFGYGPTPLPRLGVGTETVAAAAAVAGGTRIVTMSTADADGARVMLLISAPALGARVRPFCYQVIGPGPEGHPVWAPDGSAIAWEDPDGVWAEEVVDDSGSDDGCAANRDTARLIAPGGSRPSWSAAPYDPRPVATSGSGQTGSGSAPRSGPQGTPGPSDSARPRASFRLAARTSPARAGRHGLRLVVTCTSACSATGTARVHARTARRLGVRTVVARGSARAAEPGGGTTLTLRFTGRAGRRLGRVRRLALSVMVRYRFAAGALAESRQTVVLR